MTTFIGIICGLIIGWLLMVNHDTTKRLAAVTKALELERESGRLTKAQLAEQIMEMEVRFAICRARTLRPFGDEYVRPYSLITKN